MNRLIIIITALALGGCAVEGATEEETEQVTSEDGARYVPLDEYGNELSPGGGNYAHISFGSGATNPAASRSGPFPDPWAPILGPFPDPWQRSSSAATPNKDKP